MATLSHPFWYLILNVNHASDSTHWCLVASKLSVVMMHVSRLLSVSVSRRNGLSKSAKASTGASRQASVTVTKASLASAMSVTHSSYRYLPQIDAHVKVTQHVQTP